jgi:hypothetical protein
MKKGSKRTDAFIDYVRQQVLETVNLISLTADPNTRPLPTLYFLQPKQGRGTYIECPWDNEAEKKAVLHLITARIYDGRRELNAVAVVTEVPAHNDSPRTDRLFIVVEDRHGTVFVEAYAINRQDNGITLEKTDDLGDARILKRMRFGRVLRKDERKKQQEDHEKKKRERWERQGFPFIG